MRGLCLILFSASVGFSGPVRAATNKKAAEAIWRLSKKWKTSVNRPGGSKGEKAKISMVLTGRLTGRVAVVTAELRAKVGKVLCSLSFYGELESGSYTFQKTGAAVGGKLKVKLKSTTCKLPSNGKKRFKIPAMPLKMFLIKSRLCPGIGARPMTTKKCLSPGR